jgi:PAS domain S-box-containing protein
MSEKTKPDDCDVLNFRIDAPYFQALYHAPIPVLIAREDGRLLMANQAFQAATGFSHDDFTTLYAWAEHLQNDAGNENEYSFNGLFEPGKVLTPLRISLKTKSGQSLVWELFNAPLGRTSDGQRMVIIVASDITRTIDYERYLETAMNRLEEEVSKRTKALNATIDKLESEIAERKRMGDALSISRERLKNMSRHTLDVLEADRRTISKELHDSIGASLAAIKFSLEEKEMQREQNHGRLDESWIRRLPTSWRPLRRPNAFPPTSDPPHWMTWDCWPPSSGTCVSFNGFMGTSVSNIGQTSPNRMFPNQ